jgi:hypothetical protein
LITRDTSSGTDRPPVGLPVVFHVADAKIQKRLAGVTLVREYESRGNR